MIRNSSYGGGTSPADSKSSSGEGFSARHIGPRASAQAYMLQALGLNSLDDLVDKVVPSAIRLKGELDLPHARSEHEALNELSRIADKNHIFRSLIGLGYFETLMPPVIQRNILENPGWYTAYTPYQAEISQGRLEALLNFQTMISDLTGLALANASLLDEATAAAEAMILCYNLRKGESQDFFVSSRCLPQTIAVIKTRARPLGICVQVGDFDDISWQNAPFGILLQYPTADGVIPNYRGLVEKAHAAGALVVVAADLLALTLLEPPGEFGADVAVGSTQRFGVPLGYGGPHAGYFATRDEFKRQIPGRIIGVSKDAQGRKALRMALQTREQHIRRDKATSNICTAQVLPAVLASMYAVYHGPTGLRNIAIGVHRHAALLASGLKKLGFSLRGESFFDSLTISVSGTKRERILQTAKQERINFRIDEVNCLGISLDELSDIAEVEKLLKIFAGGDLPFNVNDLTPTEFDIDSKLQRKSEYLTHPVFNSYHSETEMLRYIRRLEAKDLSLTTSMIPLGSCTMKLNATSEMIPISWPKLNRIHPFAPLDQAEGYRELFRQLEGMLAEITGFDSISLQPNAGSQGEYAGLLVIRAYHESRGDYGRTVCLIPQSAHGTNPATAVMAGMKVVVVACDREGNVDVVDLRSKAEANRDSLAALMVTYPSTHGVFEEHIREICEIVHAHGGQVYMDGANMNAQVGLCRPADFGADVCHLNLHKTFCIPHGGGGPGMGPIGVRAHLAQFLPSHPHLAAIEDSRRVGAIAAAPWSSACILTISWAYITMMGGRGLTEATKIAILNANYLAKKLSPYYPVLYTGKHGKVAHECILDLRSLKKSCGIEVEDVAKRLMDYGYHAPTVSFPVPGTMMIEPTESESLSEIDRFCEALISIRKEISEIESGQVDRENNVLKRAPHTALEIVAEDWDRPYSRERAAFPAEWSREHKYWPTVGRVDNAYGDRNLICSCPPVAEYS